MWWSMPEIPVPGRTRLEPTRPEASRGYIEMPCLKNNHKPEEKGRRGGEGGRGAVGKVKRG